MPDRLTIVLVGNAAEFIPQLRRVGFSEFDVIPIDELDLMSATLGGSGRLGALPETATDGPQQARQ